MVLRNIIVAVMVGGFIRRKEEYERVASEQAKSDRARKAQKRLKEIFPVFYTQSVNWASRDPHFATLPELMHNVEQMMVECGTWRKAWMTALQFLPEASERTTWPTQTLVYYECALNALHNILTEDRFLLNLTQEIAISAIAERLRITEPYEYSMHHGEDGEGGEFYAEDDSDHHQPHNS
ncbi:unnamed protein product [Notodromas monacha]|nr:unnamed protein product [Notodromas monacha]CAG0918401.1 unnamed protein product [Notodromas monacha]